MVLNFLSCLCLLNSWLINITYGFLSLWVAMVRLDDGIGKRGLQNAQHRVQTHGESAHSPLLSSSVEGRLCLRMCHCPFFYLEWPSVHVSASTIGSSTSVRRRQRIGRGFWGAAVPGTTALIHMSRELYAVCRGQLLTTARKQSKIRVAEVCDTHTVPRCWEL